MTRTEDDEWDIVTSVGITALSAAAARAVETSREGGLVHDPYAQAFVDEVPATAFPPNISGDDVWQTLASYVGVRSRFFDEFLTDAAQDGIRQVVVLAAGLDTRALRLPWPDATTVYEIDQPDVLDFKDQVLSRHQDTGSARATRTVIGVDLRHDWPAALLDAGFDPDAPSAWIAEGLLSYLPADAEDGLFAEIQKLSAPGSRVATENATQTRDTVLNNTTFGALSERIGLDPRELFYHQERQDPGERLRQAGWTTTENSASDLAHSYGKPLPAENESSMGPVQLLAAKRDA